MPHFCHRFWEKVPLFIITFNIVVYSLNGQGGQLLCKALEMNSTVEIPKPTCSTGLDRNGGIQMSCQWTQQNEGDRAYFEVASEILYKHHISELNSTNTFYITHQFSIYVGLDQILDEVVIKCIVSRHGKGRGREMCEFPLVKNYTRGKKDCKCCVPNSSIPSTDGTVIHERILLAVAIVAIAASALAFFIGVCITKYYYRYKYNISGKHFYLVRRERVQDPARGSLSTADDGVGALAMTIFTPETRAETPQQNEDSTTVFIQHPLDEERHCLKNETTGSCSGPPTPPPPRREMEKDDTGGRPEGVERSSDQQNAPIASGDTSVTDSTYCSVDDVKVMHSTAKPHKLYCKNQLCPSSHEAIRDDVKDTSSPTPELDDLYAKPDMSQKTKNKAPVESDYDNPTPPGDDFFRSILVQENGLSLPIRTVDKAGDAYGNLGASPTDESINGDELYISKPGPALI